MVDTLTKTDISIHIPWNLVIPKGNGFSNHPFSGALLVSGGYILLSIHIISYPAKFSNTLYIPLQHGLIISMRFWKNPQNFNSKKRLSFARLAKFRYKKDRQKQLGPWHFSVHCIFCQRTNPPIKPNRIFRIFNSGGHSMRSVWWVNFSSGNPHES